MIVTDLDYTLLKNDKSISEYTIDILNKCKKKNHKVVFASARPLSLMLPFTELFDADALMFCDGGGIYSNGEIIYDNCLEFFETKELIKSIKEKNKNATISVEMSKYIYYDFEVDDNWKINKPKYCNVKDLPVGSIHKFLIGTISNRRIKKIEEMISKDTYSINKYDNFIAISKIGVSKYTALKHYCLKNDINPKDVYVFGDNFNDIEMLSNSNKSVAMANAIAEVKEVSKFCTASNEEDGVARFLEGEIKNGKI